MEVGADRFLAAVAHHGDGPWVRTRLGPSVFCLRWIKGCSLGALRRSSGVPLGDADWMGSFDAAKAAIRNSMHVPPAELLECALRHLPHCFAVHRPGGAAIEPPCGMVVGAQRWAFEATFVSVVGRFADVVDVPPRNRVAWCVEAAHGNISKDPRRDFHIRMAAILESGCEATNKAPDEAPGESLPDAGAWYRPPVGAGIAVRAEQAVYVVMFGALLEQGTMHVQVEDRVPFERSGSVSTLAPAITKLSSSIRLPSRACVRSWVPSVLGAKLERVHITRSVDSLLPSSGDPRTMAMCISDATSLFRDSAAARQAQRWLLAAHEDRARDDTADRAWMAPHRVRLALECAGGSSALWSLSMPLGAAYAGPTPADNAHVLTFPRNPPLVVRPCRGGGWTASPRVSLGAHEVTPLGRVRASSSTLEAALRGLASMGLSEFWKQVLASPCSETRIAVARSVPSDTPSQARFYCHCSDQCTHTEYAPIRQRADEVVCDCAMGPGSWSRGCREFANALESTLGIALVRPAHHHALTPSGFAVRGSHMALRVSWDNRGTTVFEWMGAACADVSRSPRARAWDLVVSAGGVPVFRSTDATSMDAAGAMARAIGGEGADHPHPLLLAIRWAAREDGHAVDITLGSAGTPSLHVSIAPRF